VARVKWSAFFGGLLIGALAAADARAELDTGAPKAEAQPVADPVPLERRNGLVLGASGGIAFAGSSGYPNNARLIGNPAFFSSSPLLAGWSGSFFLMGALTDYVSFGPMFNVATFESDTWKSTGWGAGVRTEVFPFVSLVPKLADLAAYGQLGVGSTELRSKGPFPHADGTQSFFGIGVTHEWRLGRLLGGHAAAGPHVEYDLIRSESIERHWLTAGVRVVWYGGSVRLDK
jgi:hypothetical protein